MMNKFYASTGMGKLFAMTAKSDGSARAAQEAKEKAEASDYEREMARRMRAQEGIRKALEVKIKALRADFDMESDELQIMTAGEKKKQTNLATNQDEMARLRKTDHATDSRNERKGKDVR